MNMSGKSGTKTYESESRELIDEAMRRNQEVMERHKNDPRTPGIDGSPLEKDMSEVSKWFKGELKKLKTRYGIS